MKRHLLLFHPALCRSQENEPPGFSSPVAAASLQRLSSGTNFFSNLAESLLKPDTDIYYFFSLSFVLSVVWVGHWNPPSITSPAADKPTSLPSTQTDVSFVKGYCDRFYFESKQSISTFAPGSLSLALQAALTPQLNISRAMFPAPALEQAQRTLHGTCVWDDGTEKTPQLWHPPSSKSPSQLFQECSQPEPVGLCCWELKVLLPFSCASELV